MEPRASVILVKFEWTDERIENLKDLLAKGLSASQIGARMGCSRNAVIGKAHRTKSPFEQRPGRLKGEERPKVRRIRTRPPVVSHPNMMTINARAARHHPFRKAPPIATEQPVDEPIVEVRTSGKSFMELAPGDCRWPYGDVGEEGFFFCGDASLKDRVYCACHCAIAYVPTPRLTRVRKGYEVAA